MYILTVRKAVLLILTVLQQQAAMDKNFKPVDEMTGADTLIERRLATMVVSEGNWNGLWQQHRETFGNSNGGLVADILPPKVDFKKNVVIAFFGGSDRGVDGYTFVEVNTKGKTNVIRIAPHFMTTNNVLTNSYGFWIFPRPRKAVELELLVGMDNNQPVYQKVGKFEAPKPLEK